AMRADRLRAAEPQESGQVEGVVEDREQLLLSLRVEIDHQVAAGDQIDARERRCGQHVVLREDALLANALGDAESAVDLAEKTTKPLGRNVLGDALRENADARLVDGDAVDVR